MHDECPINTNHVQAYIKTTKKPHIQPFNSTYAFIGQFHKEGKNFTYHENHHIMYTLTIFHVREQ